jgi:hypothetical protein
MKAGIPIDDGLLREADETARLMGLSSMAAVVLRELAEPSGMAPGSVAALCLTAIPENLGYRQVRNLWLMAGYFGAPAVKKRKQGRAVGKR